MPLSAPVTSIATERSSGALGRVAVASMQGVRANFEDALLIDQTARFCAVYDGHLGDEAAAFAAERLHLHVAATAELSRTSLLAAFQACDDELRRNLPEGSEAGTTATFAAVREGSGPDDLRVLVANAGDSRALLWRRADASMLVTSDHRPSDAEERRRIESAGGIVCEDFEPPRIDGQLACSRALGAFKYKQGESLAPGAQKVSSVPDIYEWEARKGDLLILACDGVWDVLSNKHVVDELCSASGGDFGEAAGRILDLCIKKEADDNMTLLVVELGRAAEESSSVNVTPGNFLKTKDKEVVEQYVAFCHRFGYSLTKEMRPKAPPAAALSPADPVPGKRFAGLPLPQAAPAAEGGAATVAEGTGSDEKTLRMKVTSKRSTKFYIASAKAMIGGSAGAEELEVCGLGNAVPIAVSVATGLSAEGHEIRLIETSSIEVLSDASRRIVSSPQIRFMLRLAKS